MILKACKTKNFTFYYVQKSFRTPEGKCSTKNVERLGNIEQLKARFGEEDPVGEAKKYVAELTRAEKEARKSVMIECNPAVLLKNCIRGRSSRRWKIPGASSSSRRRTSTRCTGR